MRKYIGALILCNPRFLAFCVPATLTMRNKTTTKAVETRNERIKSSVTPSIVSPIRNLIIIVKITIMAAEILTFLTIILTSSLYLHYTTGHIFSQCIYTVI